MVQIFVSYSHKDKSYVQNGSLVHYLKERLKSKARFWLDEEIETGDHWNEKIQQNILNSQIALVLISPNFLKSDYIKNQEIKMFVNATIKKFIIFPVIISTCSTQKITWLKPRQYIPGGKQSIEKNYQGEESRKMIYKKIGDDLIKKVAEIKKPEIAANQALAAVINLFNTVEADLLTLGNGNYLKKRVHSLMFEGSPDLLTASYKGNIMQTITFKDLKKKLKTSDFEKIMVHHNILTIHYSKWLNLNPRRFSKTTGKKVKSIVAQQRKAILEMVSSLIEILGYLKTIGFNLHDHYSQIYDMLLLAQKKPAMNSR